MPRVRTALVSRNDRRGAHRRAAEATGAAHVPPESQQGVTAPLHARAATAIPRHRIATNARPREHRHDFSAVNRRAPHRETPLQKMLDDHAPAASHVELRDEG